jgi:hypothetical protein
MKYFKFDKGKIMLSHRKNIKSNVMGSKPGFFVFIFFLVHMFMFGGSGFILAYDDSPFLFALMHGGIAIFVYIVFYLVMFGVDRVRWMFINSIFGLAQTYEIINGIVTLFIKNFDFFSYPFYRHIIPSIYIILYMFLIRQFIKYLTQANKNKSRKKLADFLFLGGNIFFWLFSFGLSLF